MKICNQAVKLLFLFLCTTGCWGEELTSLPIKAGIYDDAAGSCNEDDDYNDLIRTDGTFISYLHLACEFKKIEKIGDSSFKVTKECRNPSDPDSPAETSTVIYNIISPTEFSEMNELGGISCPIVS